MRLASAGDSLLAIVDVLSRLLSAMSQSDAERALHRTGILIRAGAPSPCRSSSPNSTRKDSDSNCRPMPGR